MKTPEELKELKEDVETLKKKLAELTEDELAQVSGGQYYHDGVYIGTTYTDKYTDNTEGTIRNPGDKYFGDR